ncbi:MAG: phage/plasmid replication protein, II/X family [Bacteroidota bacterium]
MTNFNGLLLDWIGLRMPVNMLPPSLQERLYENMDSVACLKLDGKGNPSEIRWEQKRLNFDALRSDSEGLYFTCSYVGLIAYFYIGASPASLANPCNVFGTLDIKEGAEILLSRARRAFQCFLAPAEDWEMTRLDITGNYAFPDFAMVKTCLRTLLSTDSARRKATSAKNGGDTVLWAPSSDVKAGKAYHKGPHLRYLQKKGQIDISEEQLALADRLLRLEMKIGSRFFRDMQNFRKHPFFGRHWTTFTGEELADLHRGFFGPLVEGVEVRDMGRVEMIERIAELNGITQGRARAAFKTYSDIKEYGLDEVKASMPERTYYLHKKYLVQAGVSDSDLIASLPGNILPFRPVRIVLAQPVASWEDVRRAA